MKKIALLLLIYNCIASILLADPTNPQAKRGIITVVSSEFGGIEISKKYPVSNAIDGNPQTAWVCEEKETSFKKVVGLFFNFESDLEIDGISLINGYAKNDSLYKNNNSISTFEIVLPNHQVYRYSCTETTKFQNFNFPKQNIKWMIILVIDQRKGTKYKDLCISEISPTINNKKLIYEQPKFIISNNGTEYESDIIINLQNQRQYNTEKFDFGCGAQDPIVINDSTFIYSDECDDASHLEIFFLNKMTSKSIKNKLLDNYVLIDAKSKTVFILMDKDSNKIFTFDSATNKFIPSNYALKKKLSYWHWSERLDRDFSDSYKRIE
jgi:hypothetical protein